jgi:hypothetical protein
VTGQKVQIDPRAIRSEYLAELRKFIKQIETGCGQMNIDYVQLSTARDFDVALSHYLSSRRK